MTSPSLEFTRKRHVAPAIALLVIAEAALFFTFLVVIGPITMLLRLLPLTVVLVLSAAFYLGHQWTRWALFIPIAFRVWKLVPLTAAAWGVGRTGAALFFTGIVLAELSAGFILIHTARERQPSAASSSLAA